MKKFKSTYSKGILWITILLVALMGYFIVLSSYKMLSCPVQSYSFWIYALVWVVLVMALLHAFLSQIVSVSVTEKEVIVKKMYGRVVIHRDDILAVRYKKSILRDVRIWGIGGLFGHTGLFWNSDAGKYRAYVNNGRNMIEIKTTKKCYVVSCDNCNEVMALLKSTL